MVSLRRKSVHTPRSSLAVQQARNANTRQSQRTDDVPIELYQEARNEALVRYKNERKQEQQRRPQHEQERRRKIEKDDDDELDAGDLDSADSPPQPKKAPTLLERIRMEKNRVVQRCLVACRLAEPSRDVFFKQKKQEYVDAIELLKDTKRDVQELAAQVQKFTCRVTSFAGDSVSYTQFGLHNVPRQTFLHSAQQIEGHVASFSDEVQQQIIEPIDERIAMLEELLGMIAERCAVQLDVDYAKRKLAAAQQKGDVNLISERKYSLVIAQKHCAEVTKTLVEQFGVVSPDQQPEIQVLLSQFSHVMTKFFQYGDELLAPAPTRADGGDDTPIDNELLTPPSSPSTPSSLR